MATEISKIIHFEHRVKEMVIDQLFEAKMSCGLIFNAWELG